MADPLTIAGLGVAGANLISGALSGGKADQIAQDALRLEQEREADRTVLRDLLMRRVLGGVGSPEAALQYGQGTASAAFRPGGGPATQNPFERMPTFPGPQGAGAFTGLDADAARRAALDRIDPNWRPPQNSGKFGTLPGQEPSPDVPPNSPKFGTTPQQRGLQPAVAPPADDQRTARTTAQWLNRLLGGR